MPSGVRLIGGPRAAARRVAQSPEPGTAGRHRSVRRARGELQRSPCRPRSSPPCWPRSRRSGARSSRASRRCSASNYSRKRRRRSRASRSWRRRRDCRCWWTCSTLLDGMEPADRKRLRAVARAFAPTVATGDMLRFSLTRMLEKRLAKAGEQPPPVPLPERAAAVCELYAALAQCRFGAGKQGQNAYRAGAHGHAAAAEVGAVSGTLITPAALDTALAGGRADSSHRQAFAVRRHGARHRRGWPPDRAAGRPAARRLHASSIARCRSFPSTWSSKKPTSSRPKAQASAR